MIVDSHLVEAFFYMAMLICSPGLFLFSRAVSRYAINRYMPVDKIIITVINHGHIEKYEINTTGYIVDQIRSLKKKNNYER